jgi:hypothetical protein
VESSCELGYEPSGSIKMLRAAQLAAPRVVLNSTEIVSGIQLFRMRTPQGQGL